MEGIKHNFLPYLVIKNQYQDYLSLFATNKYSLFS